MANDPVTRGDTLSGLTEDESKEFHDIFMKSFLGFVCVAVFAHILAWLWRPWLPSEEGYSSLSDHLNVAVAQVTTLIS
ncbi:MAG: light-harvesting antenna LH1, beta subunit [Candidatus Competibacteraceae bacterium]|jgi:light-harvesting complex 1 beta chain|nr:light-harvesting antenna LH1, beta subunit [Candidatus Competibacteraceae bacterium]